VLDRLKHSRADGVWLAASLIYRRRQTPSWRGCITFAAKAKLPLLATNAGAVPHPRAVRFRMF